MRKLKQVRTVLIAAAAALVATGCVDVVQYVSGSGSTVDVYLRFALQKSAFEMANSFADEPQDLDAMFDEEFDLEEEDVRSELPPGVEASFTAVNDEFEYGFVLEYTAERDALNAGGAFVPRISPRGMSIPLAETGNEGDSPEGDQFAAAFLGGAKYRLMISRLLVSRVSTARIVTSTGATNVTVVELPDVWMIQFPISLWLGAAETPTLEIMF